MGDLVVEDHPLREVVTEALGRALARRRDNALALSAAVRAVLDAQPEMGISEAYDLVNSLWVRA